MKRLTTALVSLIAIAVASVFCGVGPWRSTSTAKMDHPRHARKLVAKDGGTSDSFGMSVALDRETILISAPMSKTATTRGGSVYLWPIDRLASAESVKLTANVEPVFGSFGWVVAVSGPVAIVGNPQVTDSGELLGTAHICENSASNNWRHTAVLQASRPVANEQFGTAVAIEKDRALVGAVNTNGAGAAYVFERNSANNWRQVARLAGDASKDLFGESLAVAGNRAVVGARLDSSITPELGAVYVFQSDDSGSWKRAAKLCPNSHSGHAEFGRSVATCGNTVLIGAPGENVVYLFQEDESGNWRQVTSLMPQGTCAKLRFGTSVAINERIIAVGAPYERNAAGAVYVFRRCGDGNWRQVSKLSQDFASDPRFFGSSIAISNDMLLVGECCGDGNSLASGAAYLYRLDKID